LIVAAVIVGVIAMAFSGMMFFLLEQKWPIRSPSAEQEETFTRCFRRMMFCVWLTAVLLYISLTYWWPT
jgi:hypothetical protein